MNFVLLIGAGFSRNWGGWLASEAFEFLLTCPRISSNPELRDLLWRNQSTGGFEYALAEVQANFRRDRNAYRQHLEDLQDAVNQMFRDMNEALYEQSGVHAMLRPFLANFNTIFTLNQDLLLEKHYLGNNNLALASPRKWSGSQLPGMRRLPSSEPLYSCCWARSKWAPLPEAQFNIDSRSQPCFKLHGSSNWESDDGTPMVIMGGNKAREIGLHPVLSWYAEQFKEHLFRKATRLMVIGYGFRDEHIKEVIKHAAGDYGLKMFIISPEGSELSRRLNSSNTGQIYADSAGFDDVFRMSLIGASRRPLDRILRDDTVEQKKVQRFFNH